MTKIVLIGAGNVATNLGSALYASGLNIVQVYSRKLESAKGLAEKVNASYVNSFSELLADADLFIISIPDSTIPQIALDFPMVKGIIVHTSGSTDISVLSRIQSKGYGVFYPFQTFTKSRIIPFTDIPLCLEANSSETYELLQKIALQLSSKVIAMDSSTRTWLHLTGVFTNNFTNHLLSIAHKFAIDKGFNFNLIDPLLRETIQKALIDNPRNVQTGPAIRFDQTTINLHIDKLKAYAPELAEIYKELSLSIQNFDKK